MVQGFDTPIPVYTSHFDKTETNQYTNQLLDLIWGDVFPAPVRQSIRLKITLHDMLLSVTIGVDTYITNRVCSQKKENNSAALVIAFLGRGCPKWMPGGHDGVKSGRGLPASGSS